MNVPGHPEGSTETPQRRTVLAEEQDVANQSAELQRRFKATGIVPPQTEWVPKPTAGDVVRAVSADILTERDEELPTAGAEASRLWDHPHTNRKHKPS